MHADPVLDRIAQREIEHEQRFLAELSRDGLTIVEVARDETAPRAERVPRVGVPPDRIRAGHQPSQQRGRTRSAPGSHVPSSSSFAAGGFARMPEPRPLTASSSFPWHAIRTPRECPEGAGGGDRPPCGGSLRRRSPEQACGWGWLGAVPSKMALDGTRPRRNARKMGGKSSTQKSHTR